MQGKCCDVVMVCAHIYVVKLKFSGDIFMYHIFFSFEKFYVTDHLLSRNYDDKDLFY